MYARFSFDLNGTYPGTTCQAVFESNDDVATVTAFYANNLNTGAWQDTSSDNLAGKVNFQPAKSDSPFGTVQIAVGGTHTEITIDLFSSTCLPLNFPMYPGAKFGGQSVDVGTGRYACHVVFVSQDGVAAVTAFYERELNVGYWMVTSSATGQISWRLTNGKRQCVKGHCTEPITTASGTVAIAITGDRTEITVDGNH